MFEEICSTIIKELGATGLLIIGLYFILEKGSRRIGARLKKINDELGEIIKLLEKVTWQPDHN